MMKEVEQGKPTHCHHTPQIVLRPPSFVENLEFPAIE
jgi:hypothetical protein